MALQIWREKEEDDIQNGLDIGRFVSLRLRMAHLVGEEGSKERGRNWEPYNWIMMCAEQDFPKSI
jgi:hypothetical protein